MRVGEHHPHLRLSLQRVVIVTCIYGEWGTHCECTMSL